jgi:hypothetical protein
LYLLLRRQQRMSGNTVEIVFDAVRHDESFCSHNGSTIPWRCQR